MPLVSVIIPCYNRGWILEEAVESVLSQRFRDFELIVVDDGSTDDTHERLKVYGDRIRLVRQAHGGVSAARNRGISLAGGPFIAFLDSDDLWLPHKLSEQIAFFERHPDAVVCQTEEIWVRHGVRVNPKRYHKKRSGMIFEDSVARCVVSPSAVMMHRDLFDEVGTYDESLPACEDYDLWLRTTCRFPVHLLRKPLIIKRGGHEDQLSRQSGLDRFRVYALKKMLERAPQIGLTKTQGDLAVRTLKKKCTIYAMGCMKRGRPDEARYYLELRDTFACPQVPRDVQRRAG